MFIIIMFRFQKNKQNTPIKGVKIKIGNLYFFIVLFFTKNIRRWLI